MSVAWRGEFGRELPKRKEDLGAEVRITGASKGDRLRGSGTDTLLHRRDHGYPLFFSFHIIFSLRVTHPKLDLPPAPGITFPSPRAALSLSLHIRLLLFVQSRLRNHSVPTSCSVRPAHGRPLSQSVPNKFISASVVLSPPSPRLPTSTAISSLLPCRRIPPSSSHFFPFVPG